MAGIIVPIGVSLNGLKAGISEAVTLIANMGSGLKKFGNMPVPGFMSFLSTGAAIAGLKTLVEEAGRLDDLAKRLNLGTDSVQRLGFIARQSGSDIEGMAKALSVMTKNLGSTGGAGLEAREALQRLGINVKEFIALPAEEQLYKLADAFVAGGGDADEFATVLELVGKGGMDLIPAMRMGGAALRDLGSQMKITSAESVKAIADMGDEWDKFVDNFKAGIKDDMGATVTVFNAIMENFRKRGWRGLVAATGGGMPAVERTLLEKWNQEQAQADMAPPITVEEYKRRKADARNKAWEEGISYGNQRETAATIAAGIEDAISGVMANIRAELTSGGAGGKVDGAAEQLGDAAKSMADMAEAFTTTLGKVGGDNPGYLPMSDLTVSAIKTQTTELTARLDKIVQNTTPRAPDAVGAATWA